jgi:CBS-domain-containing membrane protein
MRGLTPDRTLIMTPLMSLALVREPSRRIKLGAIGVAAFMVVLATLDVLTRSAISLPALVPPFGASVVLVFFTPESPGARPWNVLVGQTASAFVAASVLWLLPAAPISVQATLAVCGAGLAMLASRSFHPPGGATALLAVVAEKKLGFGMVLCPMAIGALILVATRMLIDASIVWFAPRSSEPLAEVTELVRPDEPSSELDAA